MAFLEGIPVILYDKVQTGTDVLNTPVFQEIPVVVENVLVCPVFADGIVGENQPEGKRAEYELCIPKKNTNVWENRVVEFYGKKWRTFGIPLQWQESMVPGIWNRKVKVERYG